MTDKDKMAETMTTIYGVESGHTKADLQKEISKLKSHVKSASAEIIRSDESWSSYTTTVSPEKANERRRDIVFLKRDLANKQSEYDELGE